MPIPLADCKGSEVASLSQSLNTGKHTLLFFYSTNCSLCKSLVPDVQQVAGANAQWMQVARICSDTSRQWAPEMLHYNVERVPCFVLLQPNGAALGSTGSPLGKQHMVSSIGTLVELAKAGVQHKRLR